MEQIIKLKKINDDSGSVASYVMIMFGMTIMLYLFGFESMWTAYQNAANGNIATSIFSSSEQFFGNILELFTSSIKGMIVGGTIGIFGAIALYVAFKNNSAIWQYIVPIIILAGLNIFVFPVSVVTDQFAFGDLNTFLSLGLLGFFNIMYILAMIEFIRGGATS